MKFFALGLGLLGLAGPNHTDQTWQQSYESGLKACHAGHWLEARNDFKQATLNRKGDSDRPTLTPGSPEEPTRWRDGALYSPNFLAAYSEYRLAMDTRDAVEQSSDFKIAESELESLVHSGQASRDACFYLDLTYASLNETDKREKLKDGFKKKKHRGRSIWMVDEQPLAPEEVSAMQLMDMTASSEPTAVPGTVPGRTQGFVPGTGPVTKQSTGPIVQAGSIGTNPLNGNPLPSIPSTGTVPSVPNKFAIVIGNDGTQLGSQAVAYASYDASVVRDGLVNFAGYDPANVLMVQNGSSTEILDKAKALSARVTQDAVVFIYFAGPGACVLGKDYLAASNTTSRFDTETMVGKSALYSSFFEKGAIIFSFYEVNRPIENGCFFGSEAPQEGAISQMEATIPDSSLTSMMANGHRIGLYARAFIQVLAELRSNRIPINEFGWQVYNKMRRGDSTGGGGGSSQTPTLPVPSHMSTTDARF